VGLEHTRGHFVKALLEGVAYNLKWIFENYQKDFGFQAEKIRAIGGGSVNEQWMQGIANITGKTVETLRQATMSGALGAASCAFVGCGIFSDFHQVNRCIEVKNTYTPDKATFELYDHLFQSYKDVYKGLKKAYLRANLKRFSQQ